MVTGPYFDENFCLINSENGMTFVLVFCAGDEKKKEEKLLFLLKNGVERGKFDRRNYKRKKKIKQN